MSDEDAHLPIPVCDETGLYKSMQCDRQNKYCWCVNVHNGVELYGTKKASNQIDCTSNSGQNKKKLYYFFSAKIIFKNDKKRIYI